MNESEHSLRNIFAEALEIGDPALRASFLDRACGSDSKLRREIEELLLAETTAGPFLPDQPAAASRSSLQELAEAADSIAWPSSAPLSEEPGGRIGRYELLEKLGEGGCGVVYRARQETPVRRQVALKIIKLGMDTRQVITRFEAERQALAMMDHLNIAKVFDAGATGESEISNSKSEIQRGRPYFVMELVRGIKITEYCDEHQLSTRDRLELFIQVCQAVQHAHQKGIIHRDLKPSNILVAVHDGVPVPKVIDFGIAKATEGKLTDQTLFTAFEQFLGTPAYMSPEQVSMTADIDTRSDIYSLGVLLYELLTGSTPFDTKELLARGVDELRRTIREKEPRRPSTRLSRPSPSGKGSGFARSQIRNQKSQIPSDLDWIVMKCLEKARARRYETASGLAADLTRHLNNEPVMARPPSRLYELQKTVRRHKVGFAATVAVIVALLLGVTLATIGFVQARRQRDMANLRAYTADMNVVHQVWEEGNLLRAQTLLKKYVPRPDEPDVRGFEWRYLWKVCQDESRYAFTNFPAAVRISLSPDGNVLAAGSERIVKLLDYASGRELDTLSLPFQATAITALAFLPTDTNILATVSERTLLFWNLANKRVTSTMTLSNAAVALSFSRDGKFLAAVGQANYTVQLWSVEDRSLVWVRRVAWAPESLTFAPDGKSLITAGGAMAEPLVWDVATGSSASFPGEHRARIQAIEFSPDGRLMATGANDGTVILWDFPERKLIDRLTAQAAATVNAVAFSPDGRWLAIGNFDSTVRLWDIAKRQQKALYRGHQSAVLHVAFSPDGRSIVSSGWDRAVRVWNLEPRSPEEVLFRGKEWIRTSIFSPDSKRLATTEIRRGILTVWDLATRRSLAELGTAANEGGAAGFSSDGKTLAHVSGRLIQLWDAATLASRGAWTNDFDFISISFAPDSRTLAVSGPPQDILDNITNRLAFWDLATQRKINKLAAAAPFASIVAFSHDGKKVATGYVHGEVRVWDYETEELLAEFTEQRQRIWALAFSPNDAWLAAGGMNGVVVFHDLRTRRTFRSVRTSTWIAGLCFTPDGKTLASAEGDGTVRLWNVATREIALELKGHAGVVSVDISFSPDGKYLATCGADGTVRLWEAAPWGEIAAGEKAKPRTQ